MEYLEVPLFDDDLFKLMVRFAINLTFLSLLVFGAFYPAQRKRNYVFSYLMMNVMVFFVCFSLKKLELQLGMALGLFAIFSIIRFRTDSMKIKDMTYLFMVIGLAVVNSLSNKQTSYAELAFANGVVVFGTILLERIFLANAGSGQSKQMLVFKDVSRLKPENRSALIEEIRDRTGLNITRYELGKLDLIADSFTINVFFDSIDGEVENKGGIRKSEFGKKI